MLDIYQKFILIVGQRDSDKLDFIEHSVLENEDRDAWKQYLKKGHIKQALENCHKKQKPYVAGIYADQLFAKKKYSEAAKYYARSSKTFEEVSLRLIQENMFNCLIEYLESVLEIILKRPDQE